MGLRAEIELQFPEELEYDEADILIEIDYSDAWDVFAEEFERYIDWHCPVRTGYLKSTVGGEQTDNLTYEVWAEAEYAQYVEYGTYKMAAQPYFEPAIQHAFGETVMVAQEIYEEAKEEFQEELDEWQLEREEEMMEEGGDGDNTVNMEISSMLLGILTVLAQAFVQAVVNGIRKVISPEFKDMKTKNGNKLCGGLFYEVEIT